MEDTQRMMQGLQFNEPLSWRAGKPIPIAELLNRLTKLSNEMKDMEQEENEKESFSSVAKELASPNLLAHKDRGVRALTACCLVDILRLCAPDAPYTESQLKDIFRMIITTVLPSLADPTNAYYAQQYYVLNSLASVKSIVLITDIPAADQLTTLLFTSFFDILAGSHPSSTGEQLGKNVQLNMTATLGIVVDESPNLPSEVIDVIVAQFLRVDSRAFDKSSSNAKKNTKAAADERQSTFMMKELPASYNMAKTVCNSSPDKLARYISQYFNDVVVDASSSASATAKGHGTKASARKANNDIDDEDLEVGALATEDDLRELRKVHQLLRELWRACPGVLQNVIPQLEAELSAGNVHLRSLATETLGDIISGIGSAGPPPAVVMDPGAWPPVSMSDGMTSNGSQNILLKPSSPRPFAQAHPHAYASFLSRCHDKSPSIRSVWATAIGRILTTAAGGVGLSQQEEEHLIKELAKILGDADERVRISAVRAVGTFSLRDVVYRLGSNGGLEKPGSVLANLAERVRDRRHTVRVEAMCTLARLWGIAFGTMISGEEQVISTLGAAPSKILDTYYANDLDIHVLIDHVLFEQLLPLSFPPIKEKAGTKLINGVPQRTPGNHTLADADPEKLDPDKIRVKRILLLVDGLDDRAKKVFLAVQSRQIMLSKVMSAYLQRCEDFNGGVMEGNGKDIKEHLGRLIENLAKTMPDRAKVSEHLWKFAKMHDRRSYELIRRCIAPESDYRDIYRCIREILRRDRDSSNGSSDLGITLTPLLYRVSRLMYNKSHVPAIMEFSRTNERSLGAIAHEVLRDISTKNPEILKAQVQGICSALQDGAPSATKDNDAGSLDNLKACASFAAKFENEVPKDRAFVQALTQYSLYGTPAKAAKYAVMILMTISDRKASVAKDLVHRCVNKFNYEKSNSLSLLAALSQLALMCPNEIDGESDAVSDIAIDKILLRTNTPSEQATQAYEWSSIIDKDCEASCWAIKLLVNRVRSHTNPDSFDENASPLMKLLEGLITRKGCLIASEGISSRQNPRLRLLAARQCLKLGLKKTTDALISAQLFNVLSLVAQDPLVPVRSSFFQRLKKYCTQAKLPQRYYTIPFLFAFEPNIGLKSDADSWIRSRAALFSAARSEQSSRNKSPPAVLEGVLPRFISTLAHHPDYTDSGSDFTDFARYFIFYLQTVGTSENISLIYHVAQRVKQCRDAVTPDTRDIDQNLYHLSDLALLTIRKFEELNSWNIQTLPGKISLPRTLFTEIKDHSQAQEIAEASFLPSDTEDTVKALVKHSLRATRSGNKKRRSEGDGNDIGRVVKKAKSLPVRKVSGEAEAKRPKASSTAKPPKQSRSKKAQGESEPTSSDRRRSGRIQDGKGKYMERDDEDDDKEMDEGVVEWIYVNKEEDDGADNQAVEDGGDKHDDTEVDGAKTSRVNGASSKVAMSNNEDVNGNEDDEANPDPQPAAVDEYELPSSPLKVSPREKRTALKGRSSNPSTTKPTKAPPAKTKAKSGRKIRTR